MNYPLLGLLLALINLPFGISGATTNEGGSLSTALNPFSQDQIVTALKEALIKGVQYASTNLGRTNGFWQDPKVHIHLPDSLQAVERGVRALGQAQLVEDFELAMNRAAEKAIPASASVLADAIQQLRVADAKAILTGANTAATEYLRRMEATNLFNLLLPIVQKATTESGATSAYKRLLEKMNFGKFGGFGELFGKGNTLDLDGYVTRKALDGLFVKLAEQEKLIRENPVERTTELLDRVFGAIRR